MLLLDLWWTAGLRIETGCQKIPFNMLELWLNCSENTLKMLKWCDNI